MLNAKIISVDGPNSDEFYDFSNVRMIIDNSSSQRIAVMRFPLIVGVVFIHTYGNTIHFSDSTVLIGDGSFFFNFIQNIMSQGIARTAVPLFYLMSGYLFFVNFSWSYNNYLKKIQSRGRTLMIPYLFWNIFTLSLIAVAQYISVTKFYFSDHNAQISTYNAYDYLNAIFGFTREPIAYQFWFIRDLMVIILITPAIHYIAKKHSIVVLVIISFLWFFNYWPLYAPSAVAFAFFYIGTHLALYNASLFSLDKYGKVILPSYLILLLFDAISKEYEFNPYVHNFGIFLGVASVLVISKYLIRMNSIRAFLLWASSCSFFVFAIHEPLLTIFRKILYKTFAPTTDIAAISLYFFAPGLVIVTALLLYLALRKAMPKALSIISGGR